MKRSKPLRRYTRLRKHGNTKHARRVRDTAYVTWVRKQPCLVRLFTQGHECAGPIEANHIGGRYGQDSDRRCVPMCHKHHEDWTGRVGGRGFFGGWPLERRREWGRWAIATTQAEHDGATTTRGG